MIHSSVFLVALTVPSGNYLFQSLLDHRLWDVEVFQKVVFMHSLA